MVRLGVHQERLALAEVNARVHLVDERRSRCETDDLLPPRHEQVIEGRLLDLVPRTLEQLKIPRAVRVTRVRNHVRMTTHQGLDVLDVAGLIVRFPGWRLDRDQRGESDEDSKDD